jgi:hypothetical protein
VKRLEFEKTGIMKRLGFKKTGNEKVRNLEEVGP